MFRINAWRLLAAGLLASGCAPMASPSDAPKQLNVHVEAESYVVKLNPKSNALLPGEREELDQYLAHLGDLKQVEFSLRRTHEGMQAASLKPVEHELLAKGADPDKIFPLSEIGVDAQGEWADVEIIAKRYVATTAGCPDMSRPDTIGIENTTSSDFGCATAAALAMSVADPRDLARGRQTAPASGVHSLGAVQRYDDNEVTPLSTETTQSSSQ